MNEFTLHHGLFGPAKKLIITEEYIDYDGLRIDKQSFVDVKYRAESIVWYKFYVGYDYQIDIKHNETKILSLKFSRYFWPNRRYSQMYSDISRYLGNYFLINRINDILDQFEVTGLLETPGLKITKENVAFEFPAHIMPWPNVGLKEYSTYFAIFDTTNAAIHKRVTFDEWNAEVLFHILKVLLNEGKTRDGAGC